MHWKVVFHEGASFNCISPSIQGGALLFPVG